MDNDNAYDMPFEEIQKEIMENLQTLNMTNSDDVNFKISQENETILKPYVRPSPAELFKLSEEDKAGFENLRLRLGLHSDESRQCVPDNVSKTEQPLVSLTAPKLLRHEKLERPVQPKIIRNHLSNISRYRIYRQYYPSAKIFSIDQDKHWPELNGFLANYHVSQDKLNTVFDFDETTKIRKKLRNGYSAIFHILDLGDSNDNEHIILDYLNSMSEKFRENQPKSCPSGDGTKATNLETVKTLEQKTVYCDLRTGLTTRNPSRSLAKQTERISETFLARRRRFCEDFIQSIGIQHTFSLLLHEDSSFSAAIPLLDDFFSDTTTESTVQLVFESPWTSWEQFGFDNCHYGLPPQIIKSTRQSWFVFFAFVSWLLSLVAKEEQKATVSSNEQALRFNTVGFIQISTRQNESQPPSVNRPQIHALLKLPSSGTMSCEQIKHHISVGFKNQLSSWKPDETLIWNVNHVALPLLEDEPDLSTLVINRTNAEDWKQQFPDKMPNLYVGEFGNNEQTMTMIWDSAKHRIPNKTNKPNVSNNFGSGWDELLDNESATAVIEMPLDKLGMFNIQKTLFALLVNLYLKALDLVGIRLGWMLTQTGNRMAAGSSLPSHSRIPCVALAVRGYKAWQYSKQICDWMTSKTGSGDEEMLRCYGSRYENFNLKHLARWFGPRLPDVTGLSPVKITRIKHQASKLLTHSKNCWLVRTIRTDLIMLLDESLLSCLTGILKAAVDVCGYQVVYLNRFMYEIPRDFYALTMLLVGESKPHAEIDCNPLENVVEPSSPKLLFVLRRESANEHAIHLCEQMKVAVQKGLDFTKEQRSDLVKQAVVQILPYDKEMLKRLQPQVAKPVLELVPMFYESKPTNQLPLRAPRPDCSSLGFVLINTCAHAKSPCKPASRTQHSRAPILLGEFMEHMSQRQWSHMQLRLLALKWLPISHIPSQHIELAHHILCPNDLTPLLSSITTEQHHGHCGFGFFLVSGQLMAHCLNSWCHGNQQTMFSTDLSEIKKLTRLFFFPEDVSSVAGMNIYGLHQKQNFEEMWERISTPVLQTWTPEEISFSMAWSRQMTSAQWLERFITVHQILSDEGFRITGLFSKCSGETSFRVTRANARARLTYLTQGISTSNEQTQFQLRSAKSQQSKDGTLKSSLVALKDYITNLPLSSEDQTALVVTFNKTVSSRRIQSNWRTQ
ncbi:hypothetical protein PHET_04818 [Paragonimus heterotremus]|uniref:Uncharacterized protein n=1 Tax=Paragonimus heterotremus TaxID=100268 RepID=A0A8J4SQ18_9TREM|nr:hypothetical protein PHET_04818 [Paragonimus heterotremus]